MQVASGLVVDRFGFVTLQRHKRTWTASLRDVTGAPMLRCVLEASSLRCQATGSAAERSALLAPRPSHGPAAPNSAHPTNRRK